MSCTIADMIRRTVQSANAMCLKACRVFSKFVGTHLFDCFLFDCFLQAPVNVRVWGALSLTTRKTNDTVAMPIVNSSWQHSKWYHAGVLWRAMPNTIRTLRNNGTLGKPRAILNKIAIVVETLIVQCTVRCNASGPRDPHRLWSSERMPMDAFWKRHPRNIWTRSIDSPKP